MEENLARELECAALIRSAYRMRRRVETIALIIC
jgi:hypothetical protein